MSAAPIRSSALAARRSAGFTLVELMIALLVSAIVLVGVFAFATIQKDTARLHQRQILIQQALEGSMHAIGKDLRMAGFGFARNCSEVRIWSAADGRLINPGAVTGDNVGNAYVDEITGEPYWVLRDGVQAHWRSAGALGLVGAEATSAAPSSAADSFDLFRGEANTSAGTGPFRVDKDQLPTTGGGARLRFSSSALLDSGDNLQLAAVRQLFIPGSFVLVVPVDDGETYVPTKQSQCVLLQVTGEVEGGAAASSWELPVGDASQFNADLEQLFGEVPNDAAAIGNQPGHDWSTNFDRLELVPLGRARWSRYEIDYAVPSRPMLVRADIIGWRDGDPEVATALDYPGCTGGVCRMPTLYLPRPQAPAPRVAIGPMIEDMQVAVGCDGWAADSPPVVAGEVPPPDPGFEEKGPASGPLANVANRRVDERDEEDDRGNDEWLGNASVEQWGPDCVYWGTAERHALQWANAGPGSETQPAPGFRMSPQVIRVTLLAKAETVAAGSDAQADAFYNQIVAIEDRPTFESVAPGREYKTLTERFQIRNGHWRDPALR